LRGSSCTADDGGGSTGTGRGGIGNSRRIAWIGAGTGRSDTIETRFVGSLDVGSKLCEGLVACGRRVDGTVHAALAVWGAATEEPDGGAGVGDL